VSLAIVPVTAPAIEFIKVADVVEFSDELIGSGEPGLLIGMHRESLSPTRHLALAVSNQDDRRIACFIDLKTVVTRPKKTEGKVRCVHFDRFVRVEVSQVNAQEAFAELDLGNGIGQVQERESGFTSQANRRRPCVKFGPSPFVCPEPVPRRDGPVRDCRNPILGPRRLERN
jgi:hypothetical protein